MKAIRGTIEADEVPDGLVLSMRVKLSFVGLCFFLVLGLIASGSAPHYAEALRGLGQTATLADNQSQLPEPETPEQTEKEPKETPPDPQDPPRQPNLAGSASGLVITIEADGSIDQPWAPIQRDGEVFTVTNNILNASILVLMNNIVLDGAGYTIQGPGRTVEGSGVEIGMWWFGANPYGNVTLKNIEIVGFKVGILVYANNALIIGNTVSDNYCGLQIYSSASVSVIGNKVSGNEIGIDDSESDSTLVGNLISDNEIGIMVQESDSVITDNTVSDNEIGISVEHPWEGPVIYHNNFVNNTQHAEDIEFRGVTHARYWDNGYPSGGNYWDDFKGMDVDGDGIAESPYIIDRYGQSSREGKRFLHMYLDEESKPIIEWIYITPDQDRYPLMKPWTVPEPTLLPLLSILGLILLPAHLRRR